jgi:Neuraminidase (sialidase)
MSTIDATAMVFVAPLHDEYAIGDRDPHQALDVRSPTRSVLATAVSPPYHTVVKIDTATNINHCSGSVTYCLQRTMPQRNNEMKQQHNKSEGQRDDAQQEANRFLAFFTVPILPSSFLLETSLRAIARWPKRYCRPNAMTLLTMYRSIDR